VLHHYGRFGRKHLVGLQIEPWYSESGELDSFMAVESNTGESWWNEIAYEIFRRDPNAFKPSLESWLAPVHTGVPHNAGNVLSIVLHLKRDADHAIVSVTDSGVGMSAATLGQLWQFGHTTKPKGHGYGLHNSAGAARSIGAEVEAAGDGPGGGSCFTLRLPPGESALVTAGIAA
jgi:hypothetical protein